MAVFPTALPDAAIKSHFAATSLPINVAPPTITGDAIEGATLTAAPGTYELETSTSRQYEWQRCDSLGYDCEELPAVESTYKLTSADVGHTLQVAETATNTVGSTTMISEPTGVVQAAVTTDPGTVTTDPGTVTTDPVDGSDPLAAITEPTDGTTDTTVPSTELQQAPLSTVTVADPDATGTSGTTTTTGTTTNTGSAAVTVSCVRMVYTIRTPRTLRKRMAGVGRVTLSARAKSQVRVSSPLRVAVAAKRGKLRKVVFRLDGKKLRIDRKAPYRATIRPSRLAPGKHVLRARVIARNGRAKTLTLRLKARGC